MQRNEKEYDVVVYGASGFAGRVVAQHLMKSLPESKSESESKVSDIRVAIAGRDELKLRELQQSCEIKPKIIIAKLDDEESLNRMVKSTNVVLNCAGPFAKYAEPVIKACVENGTDYLDISGEPLFVRDMMNKYEARAKETGARIIPFCGFDSVPADLLTFQALQEASENKFELDGVSLYYKLKGKIKINGGSIATALNMAENNAWADMSNSNLLIPGAPTKKSNASIAPRREELFQCYSTMFFMARINEKPVQRSVWQWRGSHLTADATSLPDFHYEERLLLPKSSGCMQAYFATAALAGFGLLSRNSAGRKIIGWLCPKPGQGPNVEDRRASEFSVVLIGRSKGQDKVKICMQRSGDPGNEITAALAVECARLAVRDIKDFREREAGFLTPARAFGDRLLPLLKDAGFNIEILPVQNKLTDQTHQTPEATAATPFLPSARQRRFS